MRGVEKKTEKIEHSLLQWSVLVEGKRLPRIYGAKCDPWQFGASAPLTYTQGAPERVYSPKKQKLWTAMELP